MRSQVVATPVSLRLSGELGGDLAVLAEHPYGPLSARNPATVCRAPFKLDSRGSNP
jgi:hypothetical protein